jgi:hypothetical protein
MDDDPKERNKGIDGDEVTLSCIVDRREDGEERKRKKRKKRKGDEEERERKGERKESV